MMPLPAPVSGAVVTPVAYATGSQDIFTQTLSTNFNKTLVNSNKIPNNGFPNAVLLVHIFAGFSNSSGITAPTVTAGGLAMDVKFINGSVDGHIVGAQAMLRIPPTGLPTNVLNISWASIAGKTLDVSMKIRANVYYNVNDSSLNFGDGYLTLYHSLSDPGPSVDGPLSVLAGGAVACGNAQATGGDFASDIWSADDFTELDETVGRYVRLGSSTVIYFSSFALCSYRLFAAARTEYLQSVGIVGEGGVVFAPLFAVVFAPTVE